MAIDVNPASSWADRLRRDLNPRQLEFVTAPEDAVLGLAGPGSGKTRALTYRAAHLLTEGVDPRRVLLVTFTNKAAEEMKDRIRHLIGHIPPGLLAGTFHAMGARMLRRYAERAGRTPGFTIMDADDSADMVKAAFGTLDETLDAGSRRMLFQGRLMARIISAARNASTGVDDVINQEYPDLQRLAGLAGRVEAAYEEKKIASDAVDFDDLLCLWVKLLEGDQSLAAYWQDRLQHVLVDEYQDTNVIQARLVELLAPGGAVAVVGDDAQSIYAFRQADLRNILRFEGQFPGCRVVRLEQNYRSTPQILDLANQIISHNRSQLPKTLFTIRPGGDDPWLVQARDVQQEARFVASKVASLLTQGVPLGDMAVLYRSSYLSQNLELELLNRDIPYITAGGRRFLDRAHVRDVLAFIRILANPRDELSWQRVALMQEGIGPATFQQLWRRLSGHPDPLAAAVAGAAGPSRGAGGWKTLVGELDRLARLAAGDRPLPLLLGTLMSGVYGQYLEANYEDHRERRLGIEQLAAYSASFDDVRSFLESITLNESLMLGGDAALAGQAVTLSTCHSAKGKEWDTVFITSLVRGRFPDSRSEDNIEEERRLFYVAVTRARNRLYMSFYQYDRGYGGGVYGTSPSGFLMELKGSSYAPYYLLDDGQAVPFDVG